MFYNSLLNKVVSKSNDRKVLKYVYQNPVNGEWVASDGQIMLIEHNEAIPMFKFWNPKTGNPVDENLEYLDYEHLLTAEETKLTGKVKDLGNGCTMLDDIQVISKNYKIACDFVGAERLMSYTNQAVHIYNADKSRQAFLTVVHHNFKFKIKDKKGETINVFVTYNEAEEFASIMGNDFTIRSEL